MILTALAVVHYLYVCFLVHYQLSSTTGYRFCFKTSKLNPVSRFSCFGHEQVFTATWFAAYALSVFKAIHFIFIAS